MSSLFFSPLLRRPQKEMRQLSGPGVHGPLSKTQWCVRMREQNPQVPLLMDAVPSALSKPCHALPAFHPAFTQLPFCGEHSKGGQGHIKLTKRRWTWALVPWREVYLGNAARCKPPQEWGNHLPNSISFQGLPCRTNSVQVDCVHNTGTHWTSTGDLTHVSVPLHITHERICVNSQTGTSKTQGKQLGCPEPHGKMIN